MISYEIQVKREFDLYSTQQSYTFVWKTELTNHYLRKIERRY